jgi:tetratricopeptide (TPR) repeat protein
VRTFWVVVALASGAVGVAPAQLTVTQPTQKLLVLPLAAPPQDSALSVATMDFVRERIGSLDKYKVLTITKKQLCEVLAQSGFPCDGLLDDAQARQLARHLSVHAYVTGTLERSGTAIVARVRVIDVGSSGMAAAFSVNAGNPGTPPVFGEAIAQRLHTVIRAGEHVRDCIDNRMKSQFQRALSSAQKALVVDPSSAGAHLCVGTIYEAQHIGGPDSTIATSQRALRGDSLNGTAWENIARAYQQKGDTLRAIQAFIEQLKGEPRNTQKRLAIAQLLRQMRQYQQAVNLLDAGLAVVTHDEQMTDLKKTICIEGELWRCALGGLVQEAEADSSKMRDSTFLKTIIGAAQQAADTQQLVKWSGVAVRSFPSNIPFLKVHGSALESAHHSDSAVKVYVKVAQLAPTDMGVALLVAKAMVDGAVWDTTAVRIARAAGDSAQIVARRAALAARLDSASVYLGRARTAPDSAIRLNAQVIHLTALAKLAGAGAPPDRVYAWADPLLTELAERSPADTVGPRMALRAQTAFYFVIPALQKVAADYRTMVPTKSCARARDVNDQVQRLKRAVQLGRRISNDFMNRIQPTVTQLDQAMPQVMQSFKCR